MNDMAKNLLLWVVIALVLFAIGTGLSVVAGVTAPPQGLILIHVEYGW